MSEHREFEFKVMAAICALTQAVYSIHRNRVVDDLDIDAIAEALDGLNEYVGKARYPQAEVIEFPRAWRPEESDA